MSRVGKPWGRETLPAVAIPGNPGLRIGGLEAANGSRTFYELTTIMTSAGPLRQAKID